MTESLELHGGTAIFACFGIGGVFALISKAKKELSTEEKELIMNEAAFNAQEIWDLAVTSLKQQSEALYRQFFAHITAVSVDADLLILGVPDEFSAT